jgi:hypothetical protein
VTAQPLHGRRKLTHVHLWRCVPSRQTLSTMTRLSKYEMVNKKDEICSRTTWEQFALSNVHKACHCHEIARNTRRSIRVYILLLHCSFHSYLIYNSNTATWVSLFMLSGEDRGLDMCENKIC